MKQELIEFQFYGWHLQEPMALITNWMMCAFCFFAYIQLQKANFSGLIWWKRFFWFFAISTFFGGTGHLFFQYNGIVGKFPNWITGILSGYCAGKAMLWHLQEGISKKRLNQFLSIKAVVLLSFALALKLFIFIAIDAIITYIVYCGIVGYLLCKKGRPEMRYFPYGVLVALPSAFIFLLKFNPHRWLNKDDLSHLLMLGCLIYFYVGASKQLPQKTNVIS
jgi:hypothetical protein